MKNFNIFLSVLITLLFFNCNDEFLDRIPPDKINDANFWTSPSDLKTYLNQFYEDLSTSGNWANDNLSDNQCPATRNSYIWGDYVVPSSGGDWTKAGWESIRRCNYFLQRYQTTNGDAQEIAIYSGEAKFFKSWYYFEKLSRFGDIPWLSTDLNVDSEELYNGRTSRMIVVDSVLNDLDKAIQRLPETSSEGRLTKYAALAFKSRFCLFEASFRKYHGMQDYESLFGEAISASEAIMNAGLFDVYNAGNPDKDYYNLFILDDLSNNVESIMSKTYEVDLLMHNRVRQLGEAGNGFSKDFVETYLCSDGKPISISLLYQGESVEDYDSEFANRDPRMRQSVYTSDQPYHITDEGEIQYQITPEFDNGKCFTGYRIYKGFSPTQRDFEYQRCTLDEFIFRYAEVLLNYAEAKAELEECTQSDLDKSINLLRSRVGMPDLTVEVGFVDEDWPEWEVSISPLLNEIRRERRVELAAEGMRFNDILRWKAGKLLENPKTYLGALDPQTAEYRLLYPGLTRTWDDKRYLYPIPTQELVLNTALDQNPGW
ncbi:RagB/SusD family nutrient uptake outer membrane protein [Membranihabitans marinus]|uniref:RagB/SusD family nutrient uptake outer membrane protein n=1 Tax=Membranihabitans marinus TaxID=1227546 RepID=UPI001F1E78A3|nr:RagB/SusD family nutrient uptake outer membrane protein [Membranihabitans marinus]